MNHSYAYKANLSVLLAFYFYLLFSFIIGFISISVGYYYPVYFTELQLALLALAPLILFVILAISLNKIPYLLLIGPLTWFLAIFSPIILLKSVFVILGIIFSLLAMLELLQHVNAQTISAKMFIIVLFLTDQLIKATNQGQYPISNVSSISIVVIIIATIIFLVFSYDFMNIEQVLEKSISIEKKGFALSLIPLYFCTFLFIFVFSNNGIISYGNNLNLNTSITLTVLVTLLSAILYLLVKDSILLTFKEIYLGVPASILLSFTLLFYPWFNISVLLWPIGIISLVAIMQCSLNTFTFKSKMSLIVFITVLYFSMVLLLFVILLTELYILFIAMALIILVGILITSLNRTNGQIETTSKLPEKLILEKAWKYLHKKNNIHKYSIVVLLTLIISLSTSTPIFVTIEKPNFPSSGVRVMAYNLHFGQDNNGFDNIDDVYKLITSEIAPSFISFEEVMFNGPINGYSNMFGRLKNLLGPAGYKYSYHTTNTPTFLTNAPVSFADAT